MSAKKIAVKMNKTTLRTNFINFIPYDSISLTIAFKHHLKA
ncbi:hypothetical protein HPHPA14_1600 [Helicobacter pylori Hp A-14]|nr:hypothetical protein HPHPA14_1600 [Helicobacter pylori Hp A-14]